MAFSQRFRPGRLVAGCVVVLSVALGFAGRVAADPVTPTAKDRQIAMIVTGLVRSEHLSRRELDEEITQRSVKQYLKTLDPMKLYFIQADVDAFFARQNELGGALKRGDMRFAFDVFRVFLQRVDQRVKQVDRLLAMPLDLNAEEEMVIDRDSLQYPRSEAEAFDRWRQRIKYDLLLLETEKTTGAAAIEKLQRRYHSFARRMHQTDDDELLEMYLTAVTSSFDPHSAYLSPSTLESFEISMRLQLEGIGATLRGEDGYTIVEKISPGGAAEKDGRLKAGDKIVAVGQGRDGELEDVVDMRLSDVVKLIRGKEGTVVRLAVVPKGKVERKTLELTRVKVEVKDHEAHQRIFEAGKKADGSAYRVGVIDLPGFYMDMEGARQGLPNYRSSTRDVRRILQEFNAQRVDAVVLDLRRNGGGSLPEAISLTGLFIDQGPVVQVKDANGRVQAYSDTEAGMVWGGPLVVLISKLSASASEILAGAIQDYGRGLIVGDHTTHGKGTVQSLLDLNEALFHGQPDTPKLGAVKVTMQQFYRPNGDSTQNQGVLSDIELPQLTSHLDIGEKSLDYALAFDRVQPLAFAKYRQVSSPVLQQLRAASTERCQSSKGFQKELQDIAHFDAQKERKTTSLNEKKFLAEYAEMNVDQEENKLEQMIESSGEIQRDYYLDEVLAITSEYVKLMQAGSQVTATPAGAAGQGG